jgi:pentatricopeptide repeat protein
MFNLAFSHGNATNVNVKRKTMILFLNSMFHIHYIIDATADRANGVCLDYARALCKQGHLKDALLHIANEDVDSFTYVFLLQACIKKKALTLGKLIHAHINERGFGFILERVLGNTLVNMYAKCGSLVDARRVFDQMSERDVCSWTLMISAYAKNGLPQEALSIFHQMQRTGVQPNQFTFASVLPACSSLASLEEGMEIHDEIIRSGYESDLFVGNALVDMYAKCGNIEKAREVFDKMSQPDVVSWTALMTGYALAGHIADASELFAKMPERDVWSWTVMIAAYAKHGFPAEALTLFHQMQQKGIQPNQFTFAGVLPACANLASLELGAEIHKEITRRGFHINVLVANALIDMYAKCGNIETARDVFDKMSEPDVFSWTTMIAGYVQNESAEDALELFKQMQLTGVKPDEKSFASILPACANLGALEQGMEIHEEIIKRGYESDVFVASALIDMYAKCGSLEKARELFNKRRQQDVVSWTAMIAGYAMHGFGKEALELFKEMKHSNISPNRVTLICVLSACCHAGLVDEGQRHFNCMSEQYHITPTMDHYSCMVDLLGRAGHLDEAEEFINKMPIKPDVSVWNSLLGACRLHNNVDLGEHVAERIFELNPKNATPYVLLSNIYAATGRWGDFEKVRKMMKDRELIKIPGCSWIEVNKEVHAFLVGDT